MNMRYLLPAAVLLALGPLASWAEDEATLLTELRIREKAGFFTLFVPPDFPPGAVEAGRGATVDVIGMVQADGTLVIEDVQAPGDAADFAREVRDVARFWMLRPGYDKRCLPEPARAQARIWFEVREGKPVVSFAQPRNEGSPEAGEEGSKLQVTRRPRIEYPIDALRAGREGAVETIVRIEPDGTIGEVNLVPGPLVRFFDSAIRRGFRGVRFEPFGKEGAAPVCATYTVSFRIRP